MKMYYTIPVEAHTLQVEQLITTQVEGQLTDKPKSIKT
jgi:hypothetical protein